MAIERVVILALVASALISMASAIAGTATYYTPGLTACFFSVEPSAQIIAANPILFNNRAACERRYRIRCTGPADQCRNGEITVPILDKCLACGPNELDLSLEAFSMIANATAVGRIQIDYNPV